MVMSTSSQTHTERRRNDVTAFILGDLTTRDKVT